MAHDIAVIAFELKWTKATDKKAVNFTDIAELLRGEHELTHEQRKELAGILDGLNKDKLTFSRESGLRKVRAKAKNASPYTELKLNENKYHTICARLCFLHELFKSILSESAERLGCEEIKHTDTYVRPFVAKIFKRYLEQNHKLFEERHTKVLDDLQLLDDVRKNYDEMRRQGNKYQLINAKGVASLFDKQELKRKREELSIECRNELDTYQSIGE